MRYVTATHQIRPSGSTRRARRFAIAGLAALSFVIATVETAAATSDFVHDMTASTTST